ncbi:MAG: hypothetical protein CSA96_05470 [Bacteroidetes bacterium]|nr:MAG: hypothetical protein CSA96_05470 [Bacteroidota bacterium]
MRKSCWYIGDIHGEIRLLDTLLEHLELLNPTQVVCLGDYIDRGPHPRLVVDRLMQLQWPGALLLGNHEVMMLNALNDMGMGYSPMEQWYHNGAEPTICDFGFNSFFSFRSELQARYLDFFHSLPLSHVTGLNSSLKILATHAGVSPAIPLKDQLAIVNYQAHNHYLIEHYLEMADSFLWSRDDFFSSVPDLWAGYLVVHGHTPVERMKRFARGNGMWHFHFVDNDLCFRKERKSDRVVSIDIDSGSAITGRLSALGFIEEASGGVRMQSFTVSRDQLLARDLGMLEF